MLCICHRGVRSRAASHLNFTVCPRVPRGAWWKRSASPRTRSAGHTVLRRWEQLSRESFGPAPSRPISAGQVAPASNQPDAATRIFMLARG